MCATHSQPPLVERAHWKGAVAFGDLLGHSSCHKSPQNVTHEDPPHSSVKLLQNVPLQGPHPLAMRVATRAKVQKREQVFGRHP